MRPIIHPTTRNGHLSVAAAGQLRRLMAHLRRDLDRYERAFSTWSHSRLLRERQAEVRIHLIEAQLARLTGSGTIGTSRACPVAVPVNPRPVLLPISAYRL